MADVLSQRELDNYREQADRFIAAIDEEYYLHYAGLKDTLELEPIYEQFAELTSLEQANRIGAAVNGDRRIRELWRFACQGYLGNLTREHEERTAQIEADLTATVDGEEIPYRMLRPTIANEADRERRQRLEHARNALTEEHLLPLQLDAVAVEQAAVRELGAPNYAELHRTVRVPARRAGRARPRIPPADGADVRAGGRPALPGAGRRRPRGGEALGRGAALPRARVGHGLPGRPDAPRARGDARRPRHRSPRPGERRARRREA